MYVLHTCQVAEVAEERQSHGRSSEENCPDPGTRKQKKRVGACD